MTTAGWVWKWFKPATFQWLLSVFLFFGWFTSPSQQTPNSWGLCNLTSHSKVARPHGTQRDRKRGRHWNGDQELWVTGEVGGSGLGKKKNKTSGRSALLRGLRSSIAPVPTDVCQIWIPDICGTLQCRRRCRSHRTPASKADEGERGKTRTGEGMRRAGGGGCWVIRAITRQRSVTANYICPHRLGGDRRGGDPDLPASTDYCATVCVYVYYFYMCVARVIREPTCHTTLQAIISFSKDKQNETSRLELASLGLVN